MLVCTVKLSTYLIRCHSQTVAVSSETFIPMFTPLLLAPSCSWSPKSFFIGGGEVISCLSVSKDFVVFVVVVIGFDVVVVVVVVVVGILTVLVTFLDEAEKTREH